jgi:hypothetical protein
VAASGERDRGAHQVAAPFGKEPDHLVLARTARWVGVLVVTSHAITSSTPRTKLPRPPFRVRAPTSAAI